MIETSDKIEIYLEIGKKRVIAGAIDWPGWCRIGKSDEEAIKALCNYGKRYAPIPHSAGLEFHPPTEASAFKVIERIDGNPTTDFGTPGIPPEYDHKPVKKSELRRLQDLLAACWREFDKVTITSLGKELTKGPRGGGRTREGIISHVMEAEKHYLESMGVKLNQNEDHDNGESISQRRQTILKALVSSANGELPTRGPRGGWRWTARYFVRRNAWHVLDHAWELEDRVL